MTVQTHASDVYEIVEKRMNVVRRWSTMGAFWVFSLLSMGSAIPVPSTKAWAVVRGGSCMAGGLPDALQRTGRAL